MKDYYISIIELVERLIEQENEAIMMYSKSATEVGDAVVQPTLLQIIQQKREHRAMLEHCLDELQDQFAIDEGIV